MKTTILVKDPGAKAQAVSTSTNPDVLRNIIGYEYQSLEIPTYDETGVPIDYGAFLVILHAHRETAIAAELQPHIWFPAEPIRGKVAILKQDPNGGFSSLSEADLERANVLLSERDMSGVGDDANRGTPGKGRPFNSVTERNQRRAAHEFGPLNEIDDLSAVIRAHAEIEKRLLERLKLHAPSPHFLEDRTGSFDFAQLVKLCAAFDIVPHGIVECLKKLGQLRNKFVHEPGYLPTNGELHAASETLSPMYNDLDYLAFTIQESFPEDAPRNLTVESLLLRALFYTALIFTRDYPENLRG